MDRQPPHVQQKFLALCPAATTGEAGPEDFAGTHEEIRGRMPVFHWMVEFPEVFYAERPDPLDENQVNRAAHMDAFVGNPPFAGKKWDY